MIAGLLPIAGGALGATVMYLFDPERGSRRRAMLRDQILSGASKLEEALETVARDVAHRAQGIAAEARSKMEDNPVPDPVLVGRVRAKMGRVASHPGAIEVAAEQGRVILTGPILKHEHEDLLRAVRSVPGVTEVEDRLEVHKSAEGVSALQGGRRRDERFELMQQNWSPAARAFAGTTGSMLLLYGLKNRNLVGLAATVAGTAVLLRGATNMPLTRLAGLTGRRAIDIQKTINVEAPIGKVFDTLTHYENFPHFMTHVREVTVREDGRSHWRIAGPAGISIEFDVVTTKLQPNKVLAWKTVSGATVEHAGKICFEPVNGGGTRLDVKMSYNPPAGALGHVVAKIFGADPKSVLDEDLLRMKTFLETGKAAHDAAQP